MNKHTYDPMCNCASCRAEFERRFKDAVTPTSQLMSKTAMKLCEVCGETRGPVCTYCHNAQRYVESLVGALAIPRPPEKVREATRQISLATRGLWSNAAQL